MTESLKSVAEIVKEVGVPGLVVIWVLWRLERRMDRGFARVNRRVARLGVAATSIVKTFHGDESDEELGDD